MEVIVDLALIVVAVLAVVAGWRRGAVVSIGTLVGLVLGLWAGITIIPPVLTWLTSLGWLSGLGTGAIIWRTVIAVGIVSACATLIYTLVHALAVMLRRRLGKGAIRGADSAVGAVAGLLTWAAVVWMAAGVLQTTGLTPVTQVVGSSQVVAGLNRLSPVPSASAVGALDNVLGDAGLPRVFAGGNEPIAAVQAPDPTIPGAVNARAGGVVKVLASEPACGTDSEGSGWVVAPHRVMTNAHVVAGSAGVTVQVGGSGPSLPGTLVVYDPERDLAVIDVPALTTSPLPLGPELTAGADSVVAGYPGNGPYSVVPARVRQVIDASGTDIYRAQTVVREVYSLRSIVRPGNSGGPLFDDTGRVVGVVFARSSVDANTGYALTASEIAPVVAAAGSTTPVSSGACAAE
ncbi:MAG: hypothetical protein QOH55_1147 [Microbacteriaceae bacterium]|nr:hypothetical protein [Microbacteriaceae bacterium]